MVSAKVFEQLTDEQFRDAEQALAAQKRERAYAKWDAELVGRYFRIIRTPQTEPPFGKFAPFQQNDYVTLERTLAVGCVDDYGHPADFVFADVVYIHIQRREDSALICSGFEVSHASRKESYLKIQPAFYSYDDFRNRLGSWSGHTGPTKHFDEVSKEEYDAALANAVSNFTGAK